MLCFDWDFCFPPLTSVDANNQLLAPLNCILSPCVMLYYSPQEGLTRYQNVSIPVPARPRMNLRPGIPGILCLWFFDELTWRTFFFSDGQQQLVRISGSCRGISTSPKSSTQKWYTKTSGSGKPPARQLKYQLHFQLLLFNLLYYSILELYHKSQNMLFSGPTAISETKDILRQPTFSFIAS